MNKLLASVSMIAFSSIASQALAETWPNWYIGLGGGMAFLNDADLSGSTNGEVSFDDGGLGTVSLGFMPYDSMGMGGMRFELEGGYHFNGLGNATGVTNTSGSMRAFSYMFNAYYDFRSASGWTPYLGAGVGGARVQLSKASGLSNTGGGDHVLAYQGMLGLSYAPSSIPMTEWSVGYRYFAAMDPEFRTSSTKLKLDDLTTHNVEVGAKFRF